MRKLPALATAPNRGHHSMIRDDDRRDVGAVVALRNGDFSAAGNGGGSRAARRPGRGKGARRRSVPKCLVAELECRLVWTSRVSSVRPLHQGNETREPAGLNRVHVGGYDRCRSGGRRDVCIRRLPATPTPHNRALRRRLRIARPSCGLRSGDLRGRRLPIPLHRASVVEGTLVLPVHRALGLSGCAALAPAARRVAFAIRFAVWFGD